LDCFLLFLIGLRYSFVLLNLNNLNLWF
jgi:hypothetical protein